MKKYIIYMVPLTLCMGLLTACGQYRNYERPNLNIDSLSPVRQEFTAADSVDVVGWRDFFRDAQLQALISEGLSNNTDLRVAKLKVDEARASLSAARKALLPSVSVGANGELSSYDGASPSKTYSVGPDVSWEVDIFGKLSNQKKQSVAALEASEDYAQAVRTQLIATIADDYYLLLMYDKQVKVTQETVKSWEDYIKTEKALVAAGQASNADVSQAEASKLSAEATLHTLLQGIQETENNLNALLGRPSGTVSRGKLEDQQLTTSLTGGVSVRQLIGRPDVREAEAQLKEAYYGVNIARAAFYPSLTLSGSAGWTNSGGSGITNPGKWLLQAIGSLTQSIFNKGQNTANLKIAKAQQEEAALNWKQSILDAGKEVNNALSNWQSTEEKLKIENQEVDKLKETLRATEAQMRYGSANSLQVITARQSLLSAQLNVVSDRYTQLSNLVNLYQAVGGGCSQ